MKTQLAYHNLIHNKARTAVALSGVAFAIILIFMQLGFLGAVKTTATLIYDALDYDIMIRSPAYLHLCDARTFPRTRLHQASAAPGVDVVRPFYVRLNRWQSPTDGSWRGILTMGTNPRDPVFTTPEIRRKAQKLTTSGFVLIDRQSRKDYGPLNGKMFGQADVGREAMLSDKRVRIVGHFRLGTGLAANGAVLMSHQGFVRVALFETEEDVSLGLIRVDPNADVQRVLQVLQKQFADYPDVVVLSREEVRRRELNRWVNDTSIGIIFVMGVAVAIVVGMAIVFQVLSTDVANMIGEYATLRAMGYSNSFLTRVILQQAVILAVLGFVPGLALSELFYQITSSVANLPIEMTSGRILMVFCLSVGMCCLAGLGAIRKVHAADPADLF